MNLETFCAHVGLKKHYRSMAATAAYTVPYFDGDYSRFVGKPTAQILEMPPEHRALCFAHLLPKRADSEIQAAAWAKLFEVSAKLHDGIGNPAGYVRRAIQNIITDLARERSRYSKRNQQPHLNTSGGALDHGDDAHDYMFRRTYKRAMDLSRPLAILNDVCESDLDREIIRLRQDRDWPVPASRVAIRLGISKEQVLERLAILQDRYIDSVNPDLRRRRKKLLRPVPLAG
jgi:hypothetical protein